jgi:chitodextrinase
VKGYYVYRNGSYLATSTTTSYTNNGLTPNTIYSYTVAAYDAARNVSAQSSPPATAKTLSNDTQPPSVPTNVQAVSETPKQVKVAWTASTDNVGVMGYKVFRNGSQIGTSAAISYADTGLSPSTSYSYTVSAYDTSDNNSAQSSPPVTVITMTAIDIDAAKAMADWLQVGMVSKTVTAIYSGSLYIEETGKHTGIKVIPLEMPGGLAIGGIVDVGGTMRTENGERYMANAAVTTQ